MPRYYMILFVVCISLFFTIIWLLKKNHLREKYAMLWLFIAIILPLGFLDIGLITQVSYFLGILYSPTLMFIAATLGLLGLTLMLSVIVSHQTDRIIRLTQEMAILKNKIK